MYNSPVLVLNQSYEPLSICHARRAIVLMIEGKAEMLENGKGYVRSVYNIFPIPTVIKLDFFVKRTRRPEQKLTRFGVFHRDNYICQYCGKAEKQLTIDHVIPRSRGGLHTWENTTTACVPCNLHKAGRTPEQARMKLLSIPQMPQRNLPFYLPHRYVAHTKEWDKYLAPYNL